MTPGTLPLVDVRENDREEKGIWFDLVLNAGAAEVLDTFPSYEEAETERVALSQGPIYRVLEGRCKGMVVAEDDTCECERCDGSGEVVVQVAERSWSSPAEYEAFPCPDCDGAGRVLGYGPGGPVRIELVEAPSAALRRSA